MARSARSATLQGLEGNAKKDSWLRLRLNCDLHSDQLALAVGPGGAPLINE
jgi:hypothetical protein